MLYMSRYEEDEVARIVRIFDKHLPISLQMDNLENSRISYSIATFPTYLLTYIYSRSLY